jgi:hypothetical protein
MVRLVLLKTFTPPSLVETEDAFLRIVHGKRKFTALQCHVLPAVSVGVELALATPVTTITDHRKAQGRELARNLVTVRFAYAFDLQFHHVLDVFGYFGAPETVRQTRVGRIGVNRLDTGRSKFLVADLQNAELAFFTVAMADKAVLFVHVV